ncbi:hypothetical protein HZS_856 [Henneguya salminicola]|nr:hypothetical protein HZS_856 [Henneguya salminicola]
MHTPEFYILFFSNLSLIVIIPIYHKNSLFVEYFSLLAQIPLIQKISRYPTSLIFKKNYH